MESRQSILHAMLTFALLILALLVHFGGCISQPSSVQFYIHDTIFSGKNKAADTATLVAAPHAKVEALVPDNMHFGDLVVFDDPLTRGPSVTSEQVGVAQGLYVYSGRKELSAFWAFTAFLDTPPHKGSLTFTGAEFILQQSKSRRQLAVVSGSGDFHLARGFAFLNTTKAVGSTFFTLSFDVRLYY